jgi:hypothetical protein
VRSDAVDAVRSRPVNGKAYQAKSGRKLTGWQLHAFEQFWQAFGLRKDKASAADAWLKLKVTEDSLPEILDGARRECARRARAGPDDPKPKWPQGWLSGRRWEDEIAERREERPIWS